MSAKSDYLALKDILFGHESAILEQLRLLIANHDERIGSPERLRESVADILAGALRAAGVKDRPGLALSIAPVIIDAIRSEIRNSRNEIVDALYPIMGRLTSAYVLSAFRDFTEETNRRLEGGLSGRFIWLRLYCLFTGQSYAQRILRRKTAFRVQEIMLIDADTGALVDSWRAPELQAWEQSLAGDEGRVTAMLAAVNKFAAEALKSKHRSLQSIDLGDSQIYLRMTAKLLFAIRCEGYARAALLTTLDKTIVDILEVYEPLLASQDKRVATDSAREALTALAEKIQESLIKYRRRPVFAMALYGVLALALVSYIGWRQWRHMRLETIRVSAEDIVKSYPGLAGYPIAVSLHDQDKALLASGLVPSESAKSGLEGALRDRIKELPVHSQILVLPDAAQVIRLQAELSNANEKLASLAARLREATEANEAALRTERERLAAVRAEVFSPENLFNSWAQKNAIFFGEGTRFRNPEMAERQLSSLAKLMDAGDFKVLILGFTDTLGQGKDNVQLGMDRAKAVGDALVKLGVAANRLSIVSRREEAVVATDTGPASNNRRVEFRVNFVSGIPR
jgi:outer membrane protein OmpA-like peptidoglycan-associated protein